MKNSSRPYNGNKVYAAGSIHGKQDQSYHGIRPAMKKGPAPVDIGTTSGKAQAMRFYKGGK